MLHKISTGSFVEYYRSYAMFSDQLEFNQKTGMNWYMRTGLCQNRNGPYAIYFLAQ